MPNRKHWEHIYETKFPQQVSWTQKKPVVSLSLIDTMKLAKDDAIIDVGGGDSNLVDHLLHRGFTDITVLDISSAAIDRAKARLGKKASKVNWIIADITTFIPKKHYDLWHDRATFHFLTNEDDQNHYVSQIKRWARNQVVIATFSKHGPEKCSALPISQYNAEDLASLFSSHFKLKRSLYHAHVTPFATTQEFTFAQFERENFDV